MWLCHFHSRFRVAGKLFSTSFLSPLEKEFEREERSAVMGKEWLFWGGGGGKSTGKGRSKEVAADKEAAAHVGCMCAVLKLFDLHHFPFALHHQPSLKPGSFLQDEPTLSKGPNFSSFYLLPFLR